MSAGGAETTLFEAFNLISGFHLCKESTVGGMDKIWMHTLNIASWIPLIGTIAGIARYILADSIIKHETEVWKNKIPQASQNFCDAMKLRAKVEILSMGFILCLYDILLTLGRMLVSLLRSLRGIIFKQISPTPH